MKSFDSLVVGAGIWGCTVARRLAEAGKRVLVIEKRPVVGGNCRCEIDPETGIEVHTYGSHIFHTSNEEVWKFVRRFTEFNDYRHCVLARTKACGRGVEGRGESKSRVEVEERMDQFRSSTWTQNLDSSKVEVESRRVDGLRASVDAFVSNASDGMKHSSADAIETIASTCGGESGALGDRALPGSTHHSSTSTPNFGSPSTSTPNFDSPSTSTPNFDSLHTYHLPIGKTLLEEFFGVSMKERNLKEFLAEPVDAEPFPRQKEDDRVLVGRDQKIASTCGGESGALGDRALPGSNHHSSTSTPNFDSSTSNFDSPPRTYGDAVFDAFIRGYTSKQWGVAPEKVDPSIIARLKVRDNYSTDYFDDPHQGIPADGYNKMFERMLDHPNITVRTNCSLKFEDESRSLESKSKGEESRSQESKSKNGGSDSALRLGLKTWTFQKSKSKGEESRSQESKSKNGGSDSALRLGLKTWTFQKSKSKGEESRSQESKSKNGEINSALRLGLKTWTFQKSKSKSGGFYIYDEQTGEKIPLFNFNSRLQLFYSGPIDALFNYKFGALPWRTLRFEQETLPVPDYQGNSVVNYTDADVPFTRIHEFRHYHPEWRGGGKSKSRVEVEGRRDQFRSSTWTQNLDSSKVEVESRSRRADGERASVDAFVSNASDRMKHSSADAIETIASTCGGESGALIERALPWGVDRRAWAERITSNWYDVIDPTAVAGMNCIKMSVDVNHPTDRRAIKDILQGFGVVENDADGRRVIFPAKSAGKMLGQSGIDIRRHVRSFADLFRKSIRAWSEKEAVIESHKQHRNITAYHQYIVKAELEGSICYVRFTVREEAGGKARRNEIHSSTVSRVTVYKAKSAELSGLGHAQVEDSTPFVDDKIAFFLNGVKGGGAGESKLRVEVEGREKSRVEVEGRMDQFHSSTWTQNLDSSNVEVESRSRRADGERASVDAFVSNASDRMKHSSADAIETIASTCGDESGALGDRALPGSNHHSSTSTSNFDSSTSNLDSSSQKTIIMREYSATWQQGDEPYYPINTPESAALLARYQEEVERINSRSDESKSKGGESRSFESKSKSGIDNVHSSTSTSNFNSPSTSTSNFDSSSPSTSTSNFNLIIGGRLGQYKYFDMDKSIEAALRVEIV